MEQERDFGKQEAYDVKEDEEVASAAKKDDEEEEELEEKSTSKKSSAKKAPRKKVEKEEASKEKEEEPKKPQKGGPTPAGKRRKVEMVWVCIECGHANPPGRPRMSCPACGGPVKPIREDRVRDFVIKNRRRRMGGDYSYEE